MKSKAKQLEVERGKPLQDILTEVIEATTTQAEAAKELGVDQSTISLWLAKLGLRVIRKVTPIYTLTEKGRVFIQSQETVN